MNLGQLKACLACLFRKMSAVDSQLHLEWDTELDYVEFRENCLIVMDQVQWKNL